MATYNLRGITPLDRTPTDFSETEPLQGAAAFGNHSEWTDGSIPTVNEFSSLATQPPIVAVLMQQQLAAQEQRQLKEDRRQAQREEERRQDDLRKDQIWERLLARSTDSRSEAESPHSSTRPSERIVTF